MISTVSCERVAGSENVVHFQVLFLSSLLMAAVFAADASAPHIAICTVAYAGVVLLTLFLPWTLGPIVAATVATFLTIDGYLLVPPGDEEWHGPLVRGRAVAVIWLAAFLSAMRIAGKKAARGTESLINTLIGGTFDGVVIVGSDGVVRGYRSARDELLGWKPSEVVGRNLAIFFPPPRGESQYYYLEKCQPGEGQSTFFEGGEVIGLRRDGSTFPAELTLTKTNYGVGAVYIGYIRDAGNSRDSAASRRRASRLESLGHLASGIAHEFNNVLFPVSIITSSVRDRLPSDSRESQDLDKVLSAAERGRDLSSRILAFSRGDVIERLPVSIEDIVRESTALLGSVVPATTEIRARIGSGIGAINADATQIFEVCMNLGTNAQRAIGHDHGVIEFDLQRIEIGRVDDPPLHGCPPGNYVNLRVTDTGHGMSPETVARVFEPYFTEAPDGEGTGLGLAVVKEIVISHGGRIQVISEPGRGSTFDILFPCAPPPGRREFSRTG